MNGVVDHPLVVAYLREFDSAATSGSVPLEQRLMLREEIAAHLREEIPAGTSDEAAASLIAEFGSPAEVLGHTTPLHASLTAAEPEAESAWAVGSGSRPASAGKSSPRRGSLIAGAVLAAIAVVGFGVVAIGGLLDPDPTSVVVADPAGEHRTQEGTAYFEYLAAIETLPDPLPAGAVYPTGVPEGLDSGPLDNGTEGAVMENGAGTNTAHFTWLCAWESEYLDAMSVGDKQRQVAAEAMLETWISDPAYLGYEIDADLAWSPTILGPMRLGDPSSIETDRVQSCYQAGIRVDPFA